MAYIEDYLCNVKVPSFDDEEDELGTDTPKLFVVDLLLPVLETKTLIRRREETCDGKEKDGANAVSKYSDVLQTEVTSDALKRVSGKGVLPALSRNGGIKRKDSCEEEAKDGKSISKYNNLLQRQVPINV